MEYELGVKLDHINQKVDEIGTLLNMVLRMHEKAAPKVYKEVMGEVKKTIEENSK